MIDQGACNGDATGRRYPSRAPASQTSLCLIPVDQLTIGETVSVNHLETDASGALFVPDLFNHRVLRWSAPTVVGQLADGLWGQLTYTGNLANRTGTTVPSAASLATRSEAASRSRVRSTMGP